MGLFSSMIGRFRPVAMAPASYPTNPVPESGSVRGTRGASWNVASVSATSLTQSRAMIAKRSRAAYENDSLVRTACDKLVASLIGTGIVPRSTSPDPETRAAIDKAFLAWTDVASTDPGLSDFYAQQRAAVLGMLVGGASFWRLRERRDVDGLAIPFQLSLHDSESLAERSDGSTLVQGVRLSPATGEVQAYLFKKPATGEEVEVPAEAVVHLFNPTLPGQQRGLPITSSVLLKCRELDLFCDATLLRQQLAAMVAGFITGNEDLLPADSEGGTQLRSGSLVRLAPGETVSWNTPPDGTGFVEFWRAAVDTISGAFYGMPSWFLLGSTRGEETDRTQRVQLLQFRQQLRQVQHQVIAPALLKVWRAWYAAAIAAGAVTLPAGSKPEEHAGVVFRAPRVEHLHPVQDQAARRDAVRSGFRSLSSLIEEDGDSPEQVFAEIAADQKALDALGLRVDADGRQPIGGGAPKPAPTK